jgi:hypothetical protein
MPELSTLGFQIASAAAPFEDDVQWHADETLSALRVVRVASPGRLCYARPPELEARAPIGITTASCAVDQLVQLATRGPLTDSSWNWTVGAPILAGVDGQLVQAQPGGLLTMVVVGTAISATTIMIRIGAPIALAP